MSSSWALAAAMGAVPAVVLSASAARTLRGRVIARFHLLAAAVLLVGVAFDLATYLSGAWLWLLVDIAVCRPLSAILVPAATRVLHRAMSPVEADLRTRLEEGRA